MDDSKVSRDNKSRYVLRRLRCGLIRFHRRGRLFCPFCGRAINVDLNSMIQHAEGVGRGGGRSHRPITLAAARSLRQIPLGVCQDWPVSHRLGCRCLLLINPCPARRLRVPASCCSPCFYFVLVNYYLCVACKTIYPWCLW